MKNNTIMITIIVFNILLTNELFTDSSITLIRRYGGSTYDYGECVQQTKDGGYIISGYINSYGLIKIDAKGDISWQRETPYMCEFVQQTFDGGYILVALGFLIKTDLNGNELWKDNIRKWFDYGWYVQQTIDCGYIIVGTGSYNYDRQVLLIKTDSEGNEIWNKTFGGRSFDYGWCVQQTTDGGYIIIGETYSFGEGENDVYLIKTNSNGDKIWTKTFGGIKVDRGLFVQQTTDGGYIIVGETSSNNNVGSYDFDMYLIKTDSKGDKCWSKTFGGIEDEIGLCVRQTTDGGYIIVGTTDSFGAGSWDVYLIKTDSNGNKLWDRTYGGSKAEKGKHVQQTSDGGYIIIGDTVLSSIDRDAYLIKTDSNGNVEIE